MSLQKKKKNPGNTLEAKIQCLLNMNLLWIISGIGLKLLQLFYCIAKVNLVFKLTKVTMVSIGTWHDWTLLLASQSKGFKKWWWKSSAFLEDTTKVYSSYKVQGYDWKCLIFLQQSLNQSILTFLKLAENKKLKFLLLMKLL